jgi:hypothetical protein
MNIMNIINSKPLAVFQAAVLAVLLAQTGAAFGQADSVTNTSYSELKDRESIFLTYIVVAENEYMNATNRRVQSNPLWQTNVVTAKIKLAVAFALMDGNSKLPAYEVLIGRLKIRFPASLIGRGEDYWKNYFRTNYTAMRTRAYELQNKLDPMVSNLPQPIQAWLIPVLKQIGGSGNPQIEDPTAPGGGGIPPPPIVVTPSAPPQTLVNDFFSQPDSAAASNAVSNALTQAPCPLSPEEAQQAIQAAKKGDIPALVALYQKHPCNDVLKEMVRHVLIKDGRMPPADVDAYLKALTNQDDPARNGFESKYPFLKPGGGTVTPANTDAGTTDYVTPTGDKFDIRPFLDPNTGKLMPKTVIAHYADLIGRQIDSEVIVDADYKTVKPGTVAVHTTEEPGSKIDWRFTIKQTKSAPAGQGFTVTFQLVNDGTPADAAFAATDWEGPDGKKPSTDTQFTVTFPRPGDYVVKVYGTTTKYGSKFTISQPVHF